MFTDFRTSGRILRQVTPRVCGVWTDREVFPPEIRCYDVQQIPLVLDLCKLTGTLSLPRDHPPHQNNLSQVSNLTNSQEDMTRLRVDETVENRFEDFVTFTWRLWSV